MDAAPSLASPTSSRNSGHSPAPVESSAEPNQSAANLTAVVNDYNSLLEAIRARIRSLDTTNSAIEEMSGLPNRYLGKVVGPRRTRHFGQGLFYVLHALGLRLALIEDRELVKKYRDHLEPRYRPRHTREHWRWWKRLGALDAVKSHQRSH